MLKEHGMKDYNLEERFIRMCRDAEQADRDALLRFRDWFRGMMDPEEDAVYTAAVEQCTKSLKEMKIA